MKTYMPLNGLRWSRNSGSANCDMPQSAVFGRPGGGVGCWLIFFVISAGNAADTVAATWYCNLLADSGDCYFFIILMISPAIRTMDVPMMMMIQSLREIGTTLKKSPATFIIAI